MQITRKETFGEFHRLCVYRVAVDARRVGTQRRKGNAARGGAEGHKDVVPDIAGKDRQLGMGDARGVESRAARVRGAGAIATGMPIRSRLSGRKAEAGPQPGAIASTARTRWSR